MLSDKNQALLRTLETKYITLLDVTRNIAWISLGDSPVEVELERYILDQQQQIHKKADALCSDNI